jgi:hypothetical protein
MNLTIYLSSALIIVLSRRFLPNKKQSKVFIIYISPSSRRDISRCLCKYSGAL